MTATIEATSATESAVQLSAAEKERYRWFRSIHDNHDEVEDGYDETGRCLGWRRHLNFAAAAIYGYLLSLAKRDPQMFAAVKKWQTLARRANRDGKQYGKTQVFRVLNALVREGLIAKGESFWRGKMCTGWFVAEHDCWTVVDADNNGCRLRSSYEAEQRYLAEWASRRGNRQRSQREPNLVAEGTGKVCRGN